MKKIRNISIGAMIAVGMFFGVYFGKDKLEEEPDEEEEPSSEVLTMPFTAFKSDVKQSIEDSFKTSQERVQEVTDVVLKEKKRKADENEAELKKKAHEKAVAAAEERRVAKELAAKEKAAIEKKEAEEKAEKLRKEKEVTKRKKAEESKKTKDVVREKNEVSAKPTQEKPKEVPSRGEDIGVFNISWYGADCSGCSGVTASGVSVANSITHEGMGVAAADWSVLPPKSIIEVEGYGRYIVLDKGGAIKGKKLDLLTTSEAQSSEYGRQHLEVKLIRRGG